MASVRKRKWTHNGVDREAWIVNYTDQGGKRRLKTFDKKKDADKFRTQVEVEIERGIHVPDSQSPTVKSAAADYLIALEKSMKLGDITAATLKSSEQTINCYIVSKLGDFRVKDLNSENCQKFIDDLRLKLKPNTVIRIHMNLSKFVSYCIKRKWIRFNFLRDEKLKLPAGRQQRADVPSRKDVEALLKASVNPGFYENNRPFLNRMVIVALGCFAGLRPGECLGLQWENVDFERNMLRIRHSHCSIVGLKAPKSKAGIRDIPMSPIVREALAELAQYSIVAERWTDQACPPYALRHRRWKNQPLPVDLPLKGFVLRRRQDNAGLKRCTLESTWEYTMQKAGLFDEKRKKPRFTPHAMRHAYASQLIAKGLPQLNLKTVMGHASVATTFNVYGHLFPEDRRTEEAIVAISSDFCATTARQTPATN